MKNTKRTLALVLAFALILATASIPALANTPTGDPTFTDTGSTVLNQSAVYTSSNGDGYTPYNLKWDDGAKGLISFTAQNKAETYYVRVFRCTWDVERGNWKWYYATAGTQTIRQNTGSLSVTADVSQFMDRDGLYVFISYAVDTSPLAFFGEAIVLGNVARAPLYTLGTSATPTPSPSPSQPTQNPPPANITLDTSDHTTFLPLAKVFNASNGDGWTPYNLQWVDGANGRVSVERPAGAGGVINVHAFRNGVYFSNSNGSGGSFQLSKPITEPGEYVFIAFSAVQTSNDRWMVYGEVAKSQPYNHGSAAPPVAMPNTIPGWSSIIADDTNIIAVKSDNTLWRVAGYRTPGGSDDNPITRNGLNKIMDGVASAGLGWVIKTDGSLWVSGTFFANTAGTQSVEHSTHIKLIDSGVLSVTNGPSRGFTIVKTDGSLWTWGGYFDNGSVHGLTKVTDGIISAVGVTRSSGYVIRTDGSLWSLRSVDLTLGIGAKIMDGVVSISRYDDRYYAIKTDGSLWEFGAGQTKIMDGVASFAPGKDFSIAVKTDGSVWGWGQNDYPSFENTYGPLGPVSSVKSTTTPVKIMDSGFLFVAVGAIDVVAVKTDGTLWHWGVNVGRGGNNGAYGQPAQITSGMKTIPPSGGTTAPPAGNPLDSASGWAKDGITAAVAKGFVPADIQGSYTNTITRAEFCRLAVKWLEVTLGKDINAIVAERGDPVKASHTFSDTTDANILAAYRLGVTSGTSAPTATTPGLFTPNGQFSREQAATMIRNTCKAAGIDVSNVASAGFTDINTASSWAVDGINYVRNAGIMQGTSTTPLVFSPKNNYTREQSIITFNNINYGALPKAQATAPTPTPAPFKS